MLGSQKVTVAQPRGRYVDGGEVELATWETFAWEDLLRQVVVERMLAGVATRRHVDVAEPVGVDGKAQSKSSVSRRFKAATETASGANSPPDRWAKACGPSRPTMLSSV